MIVSRVLTAAVVVFAGVALVAPGHASAADPIAGIYTYTEPGQPQGEWEIFPVCVPAGCMLKIAATVPGYGPQSKYPGFNGDAHPVNDVWTVGANLLDGITCPDGSTAPAAEVYAFDEHALTGTKSRFHGAVCGMSPAAEPKKSFTLAYKSPLKQSVELYPLMCPTWPHCEEDTVIPGQLAGATGPPPELGN
jgi:hypothetical protein